MSIEEHVDGLSEERKRVRRELNELNSRAKQLETQVEQLDVAIAALTAKRASGRRAGRGGVTKTEVASEMVSILEAAPLPRDELKRRVGEQLKQKGRALTGYPLRFKQVLATPRFHSNGELVTLA